LFPQSPCAPALAAALAATAQSSSAKPGTSTVTGRIYCADLHIDNAADVTYEDVPYSPETMPPPHEQVHTLRTYGTLDTLLNVHDDIP
jgi:hypothetical protein